MLDSAIPLGSGIEATRANGMTPRTLREATQEFESLLVNQMFRTMRSTVAKSSLLGDGEAVDTFREMLDQEVSRRIAFAGGFGIGELLYQQFTAHENVREGRGSAGVQPAEVDASRPVATMGAR